MSQEVPVNKLTVYFAKEYKYIMKNFNFIEEKTLTLHDLPKSERPRERLQKFGQSNLSDQELLALILGKGVAGEPVLVTVQKILAKFGSLKGISEASFKDLISIKGLGIAKVSQLVACFEIAHRIFKEKEFEEFEQNRLRSLTSPEEVYLNVKSKILNFNKENFFVISLDIQNRILSVDPITTGTLTSSLVHPRETFEAAIRNHAAQIILAHNHPSNSTIPSDEDLLITKRLIEAGKIMGIEIIDHLIITKYGYLSFKEEKYI